MLEHLQAKGEGYTLIYLVSHNVPFVSYSSCHMRGDTREGG